MADVRTETMTVNMGPQHPSTHGVLRLVLELDGETVVSVSPTIGYLHTGIEKTAEQKKWQQVIPLVERMDYLGAQSNSLAYALWCREAARHRGAGSRPVDPRAHRRTAAHQQPSRVVRYARHGDRRHHRDALRVPRARDPHEPQRAARGVQVLPQLHPGRRVARRHPARFQGGRDGVPRSLPRQARRVRDADHQEPDLARSHARCWRHHAAGLL